jgi:hypothetical protein
VPGEGVLPSWLLGPAVAVALWAGIAPFGLSNASSGDVAAAFTVPAAVVLVFALADWRLWLARGKPWHDWGVILLLQPAIGAAVWLTIGGLVLDLGLSREELLGLEVGPGMALVGLLTTTVSFHGRHHPDEQKR